ncbi:SDR family NAD(P)-dependent oxidoreductase [Pseudoduganella violacea]|uniref:NAD(P)-dependent dehydrogenase (Short-subunit alcohol dehydrogenase family) n=1 Tax=Pseudoduganella violacea TaxID=1715466 RepID=A0A7W5BE70_9BURK|nr:SDR family oxidoreductase [Pseudoduganella violacea]MBB3121546.1 NAD(P)-dependent dehydrogenase (short-subunit alcohol dehydrogenase family) [Pseudoduganella violacea]
MATRLASYPSLRDKCVFVTGGATGIGAELVSAFARQGARVAFVDVAQAAGEELVRRLACEGGAPPLFLGCDLGDLAALAGAMDAVAAQLGAIEVLVNNAANDQRHTLAQLQPDDWDRLLALNLRPMFFACQAVAPAMRRHGAGVIVNLSSICWHIKSAGYPAYASAKAAVHGLTRGLARELGADGIRIVTVSPGWVMTERQLALWVDAAAVEEIRRSQCLRGRLNPADVAAMVLFLAADDGAMCTAQEYIVDAGWS